MKEDFDNYENIIYEIAKSIYNAYVARYIRKQYVIVPKEEFEVIKQCHSWHLSNRAENTINLDRVIKILNSQPVTNMNHMIRRFRMENQKSTVVPRTVSSAVNSPVINPEPVVLRFPATILKKRN
jgi:hypothetical protein